MLNQLNRTGAPHSLFFFFFFQHNITARALHRPLPPPWFVSKTQGQEIVKCQQMLTESVGYKFKE